MDHIYILLIEKKNNKKATINPINKKKENKCFEYVVTVTLINEEIGKYVERITKIKHFINKYSLEGIKLSIRKR